VEFTFNSVTLLRTFIMNTAPIFYKFCMKYHLRIRNANMEMLRILYVMADIVNADGSVPEKNSCETVLDNLTVKMNLRFVEISAAV